MDAATNNLPEILIVGSSRAHGVEPDPVDGYQIRVKSESGLDHLGLIRKGDEEKSDNTVALILVGLQVELHSRTTDENGKNAGMVYANQTPHTKNIVRTISSADHRWRTEDKLVVVWVPPYTPNLVRHNQVRKQRRRWGKFLYPYEVTEARHHMRTIEKNRI